MERLNKRKTLTGVVVSDKNEKTIIVEVATYLKHPLYGKRFKRTKRFASHDEQKIAKLGDIVKISETRPFSRTKRFRLVEIKETAKAGN
ncbi:30S ribosomal protein S17 [Mycoplasma iguanae]|uniref:Small ribosomal subunit protein uS17 n=1 Tax=Mycoplasma iguanae TaxID=292461 RepID=A0ABY5RAL2_9MOLU|nr:30S ribosomal protein S17 [Mycoplasma iguanae]UVD81787.1 30S ribosomal protein S17 [Mycoplasma iguanae]